MILLKKSFWLLRIMIFMVGGQLSANAQNAALINGKIIDETNTPLQKVTIESKGENVFSTSDSQGKFSIAVKNPSTAVLLFTYVGFDNKEVKVSGKSTIEITMTPSITSMSDVVVVGYGKQRKTNLTGAVSSIQGDKLTSRPVTNLSAGLQGELAGVTVIQQSGQPGRDNGIIRVRGVGTMNDASPMVVVDGIVSSMEDVNPNDVESISVLKDASAGAIYGSRAANGVILVTTKRGKTGTPKVNYNGYAGWQKLTNMPEYLNSYEYAKLLNEGLKNEGKPARYTDDEIEKFRTGSDPVNYPNTDWLDLLYTGNGFQHSNNLSISGGTDASRYLLSLGYLSQDGLVNQTGSNRYNVRLNLDTKVSNRFSVGMTSSLSRLYITEPSGVATRTGLGELIRQANRIPPTVLNKYPDSTWARHIDGNPIAWAQDGGAMTDVAYHALGDVFAEFTIIKDLKLRGSAGIDYNAINRATQLKDIHYGDGTYQGPNSNTKMNGNGVRSILQALLTYDLSFGDHSLNVLGGASRESFNYEQTSAFRQNFPNNEITDLNGGASAGMANNGYSFQTRLGSYFGRINYNFKSKYLFEASSRYDGSSKFAADKRWGWFPSFSAGWRISKENFMQDISAISNLKLRGSYGSLGNNATGDYQYIPKIALGQNYPFGGVVNAGAAQLTASNPNLQWEKTTTFDLGIDVGLFNEKFTLSGDYYNRYTDNILIQVPVSSIYGLPAPTVNAGAMRNKGYEFQLGYNDNFGRFSYTTSFNLSFNKSNVEKYANPAKGYRIQAEGYPWNAFYGYQYIGLYQTDEEVMNAPKVTGAPVKKGDLMFKDQNNDGKIDGDDRVELGSDIPGVIYGFNLGFRYSNFDLSIFGQGAGNVESVLNNEVEFPFYNGAKAQTKHLDRWTPETPNAKFPLTHVDETYNYDNLSSFNVVNSAYLRLKNLQIGYTLPASVLQAIRISQVRIYFSGQNLITFSKLDKGFDPESQVDAQYRYPNVKIYTIGLNVNF